MGLFIRALLVSFLFYWISRKLRRWLYFQPMRPSPESSQPWNPYEILEISETSTKKEIQQAYKKALAKYHPDKVHHLGKDLQKLAREKTDEIQRAYEDLMKMSRQ